MKREKRKARIGGNIKPDNIDTNKKRTARRKNKKRNLILNLLLLIFVCVFVYSSYNVFMWVKSDRKLKRLEQGLYKEVIKKVEPNKVELEDETSSQSGSISVDFKKLKEINSDIIGWIKIDETYINYPILQGKTDEYYLKKDIYRDYDFSGSIFVYSDVKAFKDENTAIFGHNMNNHRMFAHLQKIYNGELGKDIDVEICTENENHIYKVFSCYTEKPDINVIQNTFSEKEKKNYIDKAIEKSQIDFNQKIDYTKKIISLITCGSSSKNRIVVHAIEQ